MTIRDTSSRSLPSLSKIDQLYSTRSSRDTVTKVLVLETSRVSLKPLKLNKLSEETYDQKLFISNDLFI